MTQKAITNKKAYRDYFFTDTYECGIELKGGEVKSVRDGKINFKGAFGKVEGEEVYLYNLHIDTYKEASYLNPDPDRKRKLLLHKHEIKKILASVTIKGMALIPTKMYFNRRGLLKVELGVAKGKRQYDKRETIKKRSIERSLAKSMKFRNR